MQLNLLFLPLLGGYLFYTRCFVTAYQARLCDGHRLIFHAAGFGALALMAARLLIVAADHAPKLSDQSVFFALMVVLGAATAPWVAFLWSGYRVLELQDGIRTERSKLLAGALILVLCLILMFKVLALVGHSRLQGLALVLIAGTGVSGVLAIITVALDSKMRQREFWMPPHAIFARLSLLTLIAVELLVVLILRAEDARQIWPEILPFEMGGTAIGAFCLCIASWIVINRLLPPEFTIERAHRRQESDGLEQLLFQASIDKDYVQVSLANGKVYVGLVDWLPLNIRARGAYLRILPFHSGYRENNTKKIALDTHYQPWLDRDIDPHWFFKIIPIADIEIAGLFRQDVFDNFQSTESVSASHEPAAAMPAGVEVPPPSDSAPGLSEQTGAAS